MLKMYVTLTKLKFSKLLLMLKINWMKMSKCWQIDTTEKKKKRIVIGRSLARKELNILLSATSTTGGLWAFVYKRQHSHSRLK